MIKCKDCLSFIKKNIFDGRCTKSDHDFGYEYGCIFAEHRDGLQVCCATCRHILDLNDSLHHTRCGLDMFDLNGYGIAIRLKTEKMLCPEWAPREEKR